jgi:hypothetical protein
MKDKDQIEKMTEMNPASCLAIAQECRKKYSTDVVQSGTSFD